MILFDNNNLFLITFVSNVLVLKCMLPYKVACIVKGCTISYKEKTHTFNTNFSSHARSYSVTLTILC
jgi:hypothetical protein